METVSPSGSAFDVADWRIQTFALYSRVRERAVSSPSQAHQLWVDERNRMFRDHPASALSPAVQADFTGLDVATYDPDFRFQVSIEPTGAGTERAVATGTDGTVLFVQLGTVQIPHLGSLALWKLSGYGGGLFLPFRDSTAGKTGGSYGAGRYLLDTIKGSHLGGDSSRLILDFNFAYNPSCAYDEAWACPLPGPSNRLSAAIPVGERYTPSLTTDSEAGEGS